MDTFERDKSGKTAVRAETVTMAAVLSAVGSRGAGSRAAVARSLGLSRTTVSTLVGKLIGLGLVAEKSVQRAGRGRPGIILDLDDSRWRALGAEFHSGTWSFVATDLKGEIRRMASVPVEGGGPDAFLAALVSGMRDFAEATEGDILPAIGIGAPGLVDCDRGLIIRAEDLGWRQVRVAETVESLLGKRALLINRHRASGLAEARFGVGRGVHSMVYIGIGTGISAAFITDGALMDGRTFSAGEIGHTIMDRSGPTCGCGKRGCLHVYASGSAMGARAAALIGAGRSSGLEASAGTAGPISGEAVCTAALGGDLLALECLSEAASYLGLCAANIITSLNPDKIIIGGPLGLMEGPLVDLIREEAGRWAMPDALKAVSIERGVIKDYVGALGAACRVLDLKLELATGASS